MIHRFGGLFLPPDNVLNQNALDYVIEIVEAEMFGEELYPSLPSKAAVYFYNIISNHIFHDGGKRTGLEAALLFLEKNNFKLNSEVQDEELINLALDVAKSELSLDYISEWFSTHISEKDTFFC